MLRLKNISNAIPQPLVDAYSYKLLTILWSYELDDDKVADYFGNLPEVYALVRDIW